MVSLEKKNSKFNLFDTFIVKQKSQSATKVAYVFVMILENSYLVLIALISENLATDVFRGRATSKISFFDTAILRQEWRSGTNVLNII